MDTFVAEKYKSLLQGLYFYEKPLINKLTKIAKENQEKATVIVQIVLDHIKEVSYMCKLPVINLVDSLMRHAGGDYFNIFCEHIASLFEYVLKEDQTCGGEMYRLRQTWTDFLPEQILNDVDTNAKKMSRIHEVFQDEPLEKQETSKAGMSSVSLYDDHKEEEEEIKSNGEEVLNPVVEQEQMKLIESGNNASVSTESDIVSLKMSDNEKSNSIISETIALCISMDETSNSGIKESESPEKKMGNKDTENSNSDYRLRKRPSVDAEVSSLMADASIFVEQTEEKSGKSDSIYKEIHHDIQETDQSMKMGIEAIKELDDKILVEATAHVIRTLLDNVCETRKKELASLSDLVVSSVGENLEEASIVESKIAYEGKTIESERETDKKCNETYSEEHLLQGKPGANETGLTSDMEVDNK